MTARFTAQRLRTTLVALPLAALAALLTPLAGHAAEGRYTFAGDEVTDTATGLVWKRCAFGQSWTGTACGGQVDNRQWHEALAVAKAEADASGLAWRLPNPKELSSIADRTRNNPAIDPAVFPGVSGRQWYWTSTPMAADATQVWTMDFYGAYTQTYPGRGYDLGIRLVRNAQ